MYRNTQSTPPNMDWSMATFGPAGQDRPSSMDASLLGYDFAHQRAPADLNTPPKTPDVCSGPRLIPKVRLQDQVAEPTAAPSRHSAHSSVSSTGFPANYSHGPYFQHPDISRGSTSPNTSFQALTPVSDTSPNTSMYGAQLDSPMSFLGTPSRPAINHGRSISTSAVPSHTRNFSNSSIDGSVLTRYGYPTYRNIPQASLGVRPQTASALSFLSPIPMPDLPMSSVANIPRTQPKTSANVPQLAPSAELPVPSMPSGQPNFPISHSSSSALNFDTTDIYLTSFNPVQTGNVQSYLTSPNPSPSLVRRIQEPARCLQTHFWYDVRQLRHWSDFNTKTISSTRNLLDLMNIPVAASSLPIPKKVDTNPDTQGQLHEILRDFFAVKVNAALKVALGKDTAIEMRSLHSTGPVSARTQQPEFLANYPSDTEKTLSLNSSTAPSTPIDTQRGRVVGIVRPYELWNSGMRSQGPTEKIRYLTGLSALHRFMRLHGCRYGFIITEIEVVCVRYGGDGGNPMPYFGFFELSDPIRLSTHASPSSAPSSQDAQGRSELKMTAAVALFYLHFLAKSEPPPGQYSWRLDIGGPAALTRQKILERDSWMPRPNLAEKREAKRNRGWIWPEEGLSRRECAKGRGRR